MPRHVYIVTEQMSVANVYEVEAGSRAEALERILRNDYDRCFATEAWPTGVLTIRNVRRSKIPIKTTPKEDDHVGRNPDW